ncbi:LysR family transcriptional regulator [Robbsia sp. KACC 23696]|uniref:LysR family transcriptional regulator n=1 Tax=Robbsia sp. KACC 23696 TaxID=3149231 RepID=UPI00325AB062
MSTSLGIQLLPDIAVFAKVAEAESFSAVARQLGRTPSSVSKQIARLENALGVQLLVRTTRSLRLTDAGQAAYAHGRAMLSASQEVVALSDRFVKAPQGKISLSVPRAFAVKVVQPIAIDFLKCYPLVDLQLIVTDRVIDPFQEDVDLTIRITDTPPEGLTGRPLTPVRQVVCASPAYFQEYGRPDHPSELAGHRCVFLGEAPDDNVWHFHRDAEKVSVKVAGRYVCNHSPMRLDAAKAGLGIACMLDFMVGDTLSSGALEAIFTDWELRTPWQGAAWLLYPGTRYLSARHRLFVDFLVSRVCG